MNESQRLWYLQSMGIQAWLPKEAGELEPSSKTETKLEDKLQALNWQQLRQRVAQCTACDLHQTRTQTVFGVGSEQADLVIVGEAPGANEDLKGEPFVGRAGKLLEEMLHAIGLHRQQIYIANILKCRPPNNRDPKPEEQALCTAFLLQQLELLQPKLILALGRIAAQYLLKSNLSLGRLRNNLYHYGEKQIPLMASYHPAYLLRSPRDKVKSYMDLLKVKEYLS